jgi:hypothetical protein
VPPPALKMPALTIMANTAGNIIISATTNKRTLFDLPDSFDANLAQPVTKLDDAASTDEDKAETKDINEATVDFDADVAFKKQLRQAFADAGETLRATAFSASVFKCESDRSGFYHQRAESRRSQWQSLRVYQQYQWRHIADHPGLLQPQSLAGGG